MTNRKISCRDNVEETIVASSPSSSTLFVRFLFCFVFSAIVRFSLGRRDRSATYVCVCLDRRRNDVSFPGRLREKERETELRELNAEGGGSRFRSRSPSHYDASRSGVIIDRMRMRDPPRLVGDSN